MRFRRRYRSRFRSRGYAGRRRSFGRRRRRAVRRLIGYRM